MSKKPRKPKSKKPHLVDSKLESKDRVALTYPETLCVGAREILVRWAAKAGHDRCFSHPEVLAELCSLFGVAVPAGPDLTRAEFAAGCAAYQDKLYGPTIDRTPSDADTRESGRSGPVDASQPVVARLTVSTRRRVGWVGPDFFRSSADVGVVFGVVHDAPRMVGGVPAPGETYVEVREARHP